MDSVIDPMSKFHRQMAQMIMERVRREVIEPLFRWTFGVEPPAIDLGGGLPVAPRVSLVQAAEPAKGAGLTWAGHGPETDAGLVVDEPVIVLCRGGIGS